MNMQNFYQRLSVRSKRGDQRKLANLTHISRDQVLKATGEDTWFIWWKPEETES